MDILVHSFISHECEDFEIECVVHFTPEEKQTKDYPGARLEVISFDFWLKFSDNEYISMPNSFAMKYDTKEFNHRMIQEIKENYKIGIY